MPHPDNKPSIARSPISMALPVQNQAALVEKAVPAWVSALQKLERPFELLVVDDASSDDTLTRARSVAARHPEVIVLTHETPRGYGAALRTALEKAKHPLFFYSSLDYPYQTSDLKKLLELIDDVDIVSGVRAARRPPRWYRNWRRVSDLLLRVLIGLRRDPLQGWLGVKQHLYNRLMRTAFGVHLADVECAYKLCRREIFDRLPIQSEGVFVHTEIIAKATFRTLWLDETPIGAQGGVPPEALQVPFRWRDRWRDMRRVFSHPDFGPSPPKAEPAAEAQEAAAPTT